jgi:hypothetical protein
MNETAVIYSNGSQECERIGMLLRSLGGEYHQYELDKDFTSSQFVAEFGSEAEFPQVSIGYKHIGSIKETLQYLKTKEVL